MLKREHLRPYQEFIVGKIVQSVRPGPEKLPGLMVAFEPGGGKTVSVLTGFDDALNEGLIRKALIVAPLLVAQTVWPEEPQEWEHLQHLRPLLIRVEDNDPEVLARSLPVYHEALTRFRNETATWFTFGLSPQDFAGLLRLLKISPEQRAARTRDAAEISIRDELMGRLVADPAPIHVINREALPWLWDYARRKKTWPYDVMAIDDCREGRTAKTRVKRDKEKQEKAPLSRWGIMAHARKHMKAVIQLTGTPTPKGLHNMWGLIYLIDLGKRLGTAKTPFYERYFAMNEYFQPTDPKEGAFKAIMSKVTDIMFSLRPEDLPDLPDFIIDPIRVKLNDKVLKEYRRFERTLVSEEYDVEAANGGVAHGKKLQFANGSMFREDGKDVWIHDAKIEALKELVERLDGTPLLVTYDFEFDKERIMRAFKDAVLLTPTNSMQFTRDWNADKIRVGLCHRASAGHGLNLQKGTGHMCEYGLTTDAELYLQFKKRLHRPGRKTTVFNHVIISEGTIDEDVFPMYLDPKIETQERVLEHVRIDLRDPDLVDLLS
ncbi:hypothetical protein AEAC466_04595 [Asticcacaulis sp. AC466]|uniref:SNF2-related protein n=1 Tax=Asticcacaulis sp. AC466 TaxID=1282362 RepID=UPI0003C3F260|nr:SNF2-related protein [Asticcacaulis sp. AC466]ESQ85448.1 hypothetical protein AEAC466_04595 [Asticcacaulis sp. AC466]